jgi:RNA polymerase sigma factor (sigma-70 family)
VVQFDKEASQTRDFWIAKNALRRASLAQDDNQTAPLPKFLNKKALYPVFMDEVERLAMAEAVLSETRPVERSADELLEDMVRQHSRLVYRVAYAALRSHQEAEDATQETFLRVIRYGRKLAAVENPKTWLARIAWRVALDRSQKQRVRRESSFDDCEKQFPDLVSSERPAYEKLEESEARARLARLIAALPEKLRWPLILSALEEMSPAEVAATLGINEAAVRSRVFRARQILRQKLTGPANKR